MRFDSYIREIVSKLSNPMGLPDTPPWVKPLTGIYIMILMKLICTCLSHCSSVISRAKITTLVLLVLIEFWLLAGNIATFFQPSTICFMHWIFLYIDCESKIVYLPFEYNYHILARV